MRIQLARTIIAAGACAALLPLAGSAAAQAATKNLPSCEDGGCSWVMFASDDAGNMTELSGSFASAGDGSLFVPEGTDTMLTLPDGSFMSISDVTGSIDPILGFAAAAGTTTTGRTFVFNFQLPIALAGSLITDSKVSYSLTSTAPGAFLAQIDPLLGGKVVTAQNVDTSVGGLSPLGMGVNVGDRFFFVGGPDTHNSPVYSTASSFVGNLAYDLMSVTVGFALSPRANVGLSGFVEQNLAPVPEPTTAMLLLAGLGLAGAALRRRGG